MAIWYITGSSVLLFFGTYAAGISMGWSGVSVLTVWISLEVILMASVPLLKVDTVEASSATMVYFVVQVLGGFGILSGYVILSSHMGGDCYSILGSFLAVLGCFAKIGSYPAYWWVGRCMSQLTWHGCFWISCPAKIVPLYLLWCMVGVPYIDNWVQLGVFFTTLSGVVLSIKVNDFRVLYAYSSIIHSASMMLVALTGLLDYLIYYWLLYTLICFGFVATMSRYNVSLDSDVHKFGAADKGCFTILSGFYAFSLSGIPPLFGFLLKYIMIKACFSAYPVATAHLALVGFFSVRFYYKIFKSLASSAWTEVPTFDGQVSECGNDYIFGLCFGIHVLPAFIIYGLFCF